MNPTTKAIEILLVEDDPGDIDLIEEALEDAKLQINLNSVRDGVEALAYLRREGKYTQAISPDLILLDLNLPRRDGREVLQDIKGDNYFKRIPVVVLTTSDAEDDILKSYNLGANCYVSKPLGMQDFIKIVESIENFWFTVVKLPPK
ncbi:MAG: response regulator [Coleofasciculus sp. C1-SOL-03]|uniref:response regulator n=1 Tax=Coleofasciculus sp. C1-SOL-03 TaxID=3069522 RepID=UPI0032FA3872